MSESRVAVVTGAASGIGRATALAIAKEGYAVVCAGHNEDGLRTLAADVQQLGVDSTWLVVSVEDPKDLDRLAELVGNRYGRLDTLIQIAGIGCYKPFWEVSDDEIDRVMAVNVRSMLSLARRALPLLRDSQGTIVNMASVRAFRGGRDLAVYSASKGAIISMTRSLAHEVGQFGIRANAIAPGTIDTPLLDRYVAAQGEPRAFKTSLQSEQPLGRIGTPEDVAAAAVYLATSASQWITGIALTVDGGLTA